MSDIKSQYPNKNNRIKNKKNHKYVIDNIYQCYCRIVIQVINNTRNLSVVVKILCIRTNKYEYLVDKKNKWKCKAIKMSRKFHCQYSLIA